MAVARHYDTVAFDVRDNAAMLFFAVTEQSGDIRHYLLLMRADGSEPSGSRVAKALTWTPAKPA